MDAASQRFGIRTLRQLVRRSVFVPRSAERVFRLSEETSRVRRALLTTTIIWLLYNVAVFEEKVEILGATVAIPHVVIGFTVFMISVYFFMSFISNLLQDLKEFQHSELFQIADAIHPAVKDLEHLVTRIDASRISRERDESILRTRENSDEHIRPTGSGMEHSGFYHAVAAKDPRKALDMLEAWRQRYQDYYEERLKHDTANFEGVVDGLRNELELITGKIKDILLELSSRQSMLYTIPNMAHSVIELWTPVILWLSSVVMFIYLLFW